MDNIRGAARSVIAVADADRDERGCVAALLRDDGHEVDEIADLARGRGTASWQRHELVVLDAGMHDLEVLRSASERTPRPVVPATPLILLIGRGWNARPGMAATTEPPSNAPTWTPAMALQDLVFILPKDAAADLLVCNVRLLLRQSRLARMIEVERQRAEHRARVIDGLAKARRQGINAQSRARLNPWGI